MFAKTANVSITLKLGLSFGKGNRMSEKLAFAAVLVVVVLLGIVAVPLVVAFVFVGALLAAVGIPLLFGIMMLSLMYEAEG